MLKVINQVDFDRLYENAWGQAVDVLEEIQKAGKQDELMAYLEELFYDCVDIVELNDMLAYEWEDVYKEIGMPSNDEEEEEED